MAQSKVAAQAFKDNYVAGLIEAGATAPMPTMPEQDLGEMAGILYDVQNGVKVGVNDGIPKVVIRDGVKGFHIGHPDAAFPVPDGGYNAAGISKLTDQERMNLAQKIHSRGHGKTFKDYSRGGIEDTYNAFFK